MCERTYPGLFALVTYVPWIVCTVLVKVSNSSISSEFFSFFDRHKGGSQFKSLCKKTWLCGEKCLAKNKFNEQSAVPIRQDSDV